MARKKRRNREMNLARPCNRAWFWMPCTECGAAAGEPCKSPAGVPRRSPHHPRLTTAPTAAAHNKAESHQKHS